MKKYKIYFRMEGDADVWADSEEEARSAFCELSPKYLAGQTYEVIPEIDDLKCIAEDNVWDASFATLRAELS